ncbi:MAG: GAF domain-containing protein [Leptolyngbyaceae cyanobacterium HOT.MB2.61]|nr:GAF domain-containing protein [Leptolyngbyaceae cyanobacterium HOT.MB2.61]
MNPDEPKSFGSGDTSNRPCLDSCQDSRREEPHRLVPLLQAELSEVLNSAIASIGQFRVFADHHWECEFYSTGCERLFGYTAEELVANKQLWIAQVPEEDLRSPILSRIENTLLEPAGTVEFRFRHKDGNIRWIAGTFTIYRDETEGCWTVTMLTTNITERKQTEIALQTSEERYRLATQAGRVGVWDWNLKTNEIYVDPNLKTILGYDDGEISDSISDWHRLIHPEDLQLVLSAIDAYLTGKIPEYVVEYRMQHKDGNFRWFLARGVVFRDERGKPERMLGTRTDITERTRVEEALRQKADWEGLLRSITQRMRQSLDLDQILTTAVTEVQQTLRADRALIFRLKPDGLGQVISESVAPEYPSTQEMFWVDECFPSECYEYYCQGTPRIVPDVAADEWAACLAEFMQEVGVKSKVVASITQNTENGSVRVWGLLIVHACSHYRQWQPAEAELLQQISHQLAIAIQQADLYQQLQTELAERKQAQLGMRQAIEQEQQTREREQFIATIAQNIRQSLDLDEILTTTVKEVQQFLEVERVVIYRFNPNWGGKVIAEALNVLSFSILGQEIYDPCFASSMVHPYCKGRIHAINDVLAVDLQSCYAELLTSLNVRALLVLPIVVQENLWGLLIAHQCTGPRNWQQVSWHLLRQLSTQLAIGIYQAELYQQTQQQAEKERATHRVIQAIRNSLDLTTIFTTATTEIGKLLKVDRAEIVQYQPERGIWLNVASYRCTPDLPDALGLVIPDEDNQFAAQLKRLEIVQINNYRLEADGTNQPFAQTYPGAWLLVPLQMGFSIWGSLSLNRIRPRGLWQTWEVELASAVADQLAIAIQQSELYQQVQQLNTNLETQVQERTNKLEQALEFEALLKRITDHVRDSLDEAQILKTVVQELAQGLDIAGCDVALRDLHRNVSVIRYEYLSEGVPPAQGGIIPLENPDDITSQILQGETFQFCRSEPDPVRPIERLFSILSCPIIDNEGVLGDLWLLRECEQSFSDLEVRLVQQVANQCAIAIRQARLYEAAQAQVTELERLNRLKDDFLSTVSHELRTPVSSIKMAAQMLETLLFRDEYGEIRDPMSGVPVTRESASLQRLSRYLQILQDECQREISLINNLLDLTRLDAEVEPLVITPINLQVWIPHVVESFVERLQSHQQTLYFDLPADLPPLATDLSYLQRILTELLTNAHKYTPSGETITIAARFVKSAASGRKRQSPSSRKAPPPSPSPPSFLLISIINTGVEIPDQELSRIFDKFYRIPNNDPWRYGGTGLGLALVRKLAEHLGATIEVTSANMETRFTLRFVWT